MSDPKGMFAGSAGQLGPHNVEPVERERFDWKRRTFSRFKYSLDRPRRSAGDSRSNCATKRLWGHRLSQEVSGTQLHRINGKFNRPEGGHHDDTCTGRTLPEALQRLQPVDSDRKST